MQMMVFLRLCVFHHVENFHSLQLITINEFSSASQSKFSAGPNACHLFLAIHYIQKQYTSVNHIRIQCDGIKAQAKTKSTFKVAPLILAKNNTNSEMVNGMGDIINPH